MANNNVDAWNNKSDEKSELKKSTNTLKEISTLKETLLCTLYGLYVGDCLGSTSEFKKPSDVPAIMKHHAPWPECLSKSMAWDKGEPTDDSDMARAILKAWTKGKKFDELEILQEFLVWKSSIPKDIGMTTAIVLQNAYSKIKNNPADWAAAAQEFYIQSPNMAANGALMRNGPIPVIFHQGGEEAEILALNATVAHSIITHYSPKAVLPCVIQTLLCRRAISANLAGKPLTEAPTLQTLHDLLIDENGPWQQWKKKTEHPQCKEWLSTVKQLSLIEKEVLKELDGWADFDFYNYDYRSVSGYSILTLRIALWALHWSFKPTTEIPALPTWFEKFHGYFVPKKPITDHHGFYTMVWVVLIGADADTYGAAAGPLLGAYHPHLIEQAQWAKDLQLKDEAEAMVDDIIKEAASATNKTH